MKCFMLRIVDRIPFGCWTEGNLIGKTIMAIYSSECDFALEISCLMISVSDILAL